MPRLLFATVAVCAVALWSRPSDAQPLDEGTLDEGPLDEGPVDPPQDPDAITRLPVLATVVEATWPPGAIEARAEATVVLQIDIDADGRVEAVEVLESAASAFAFDTAAIEAARQFVFEPAEAGGVRVPVRITYRYHFRLTEQLADPAPMPAATERAAAGVVNFKGQLLERGTRDPLPGLLVTVFRGEGETLEGFEAITDAAGTFAFYDLPDGDWRVDIAPEGYFPFRTTETVSGTEQVEAVYFVERGVYNPFDVFVEAVRPRKEVTRRTLQSAEIELIPGNFGDPIKVVRNLPGVARPYFASPAIIVRGSSPEDTRVYVDGVLVPLIYHFGGLRSIIPIGMIDSIDFLPGNFSAYYGQSMGGVLDVKLKRLRPDAVHGYTDVNVFDAGAWLEAPIGDDAAIAVALRRSYIDSVLTWAVPDNAPVDVLTAPRYWDYQTLASWRPAPGHELRLFVFGSDDVLEALFENPAEGDIALKSGQFFASTAFFRAVADHTYTPDESFSNTVRLAFGRDTVDASLGDQFFARIGLTQLTVRDTARLEVGRHTVLTAGVDSNIGFTHADFLAPRPRKEGDPDRFTDRNLDDAIRLEQDQVAGGAAVFLEAELSAIERLTVTSGVRLERIEPIGDFVIDPRLSARVQLSEPWAVVAGVGIFHQPPSPDETAAGFGNPDLSAEQAIHYSLGGEYKPRPHLQLDATVFYKDMSALVSRAAGTVDDGGALSLLNYNNGGRGRVYGLEVLAKHAFSNNFFGWITYTVSRAERLDYGSDTWRLFDFDQTHILTVIGSYQLPWNWQLGAAWRLTSGNPETPVVGAVFDSDQDEYKRILGAPNSGRLPPFHQLDLRVDKRWIYDTWRLSVYLDVQNVYNQTNTNFRDYNFDFSQVQQQQGLPVLPLLGAKGEF